MTHSSSLPHLNSGRAQVRGREGQLARPGLRCTASTLAPFRPPSTCTCSQSPLSVSPQQLDSPPTSPPSPQALSLGSAPQIQTALWKWEQHQKMHGACLNYCRRDKEPLSQHRGQGRPGVLNLIPGDQVTYWTLPKHSIEKYSGLPLFPALDQV